MYFIALFFIYSFGGWIFEIILEFARYKRLINRGFLMGPYCPIYGIAILFVLIFLKSFHQNILLLYLMIMLTCGIIEYITSFCLEKFFNVRWWDYSEFPLNINGRVCLGALMLFGFFGSIICYYINPLLLDLLHRIPEGILLTIDIIMIILLITDLAVTHFVLKKIPKNKRQNVDATDVISKQVFHEVKNSIDRLTK